MAVDPNNAHIRKKSSKRSSNATIADDVQRLLDDPAFERVFGGTREDIVKLIENSRHDGSPEFEAAEREMCRTLRCMNMLKQRLSITVQTHGLRVAEFKPASNE